MLLDSTVKRLNASRRRALAFIALSAMLVAAPGHGAPKITQDELAMLPEYCAARFAGLKSLAYKNWSDRLGAQNFGHIHHYCYALNYMNRALIEFDPKKRKNALNQAIRNFDYVLRHWGPEFQLTPTAMIFRQQAQMSLSMME